MTTGFQQQQSNFGPVLKAAACPQHAGVKLQQAEPRKQGATVEKRSFTQAGFNR